MGNYLGKKKGRGERDGEIGRGVVSKEGKVRKRKRRNSERKAEKKERRVI